MRSTLRSAAAGLLTAAALTVAPTTVTTPPAQAQATAPMSGAYEQEVLRQVNRVRARHGLRALRLSSCVDWFAETRARRMAADDVLRHLSGLSRVFASCGGSRVGENIARGDRIAQLVLAPVVQAAWDEVAQLDDTARGTGGFGSTGGHARL